MKSFIGEVDCVGSGGRLGGDEWRREDGRVSEGNKRKSEARRGEPRGHHQSNKQHPMVQASKVVKEFNGANGSKREGKNEDGRGSKRGRERSGLHACMIA